MPRKKFRSIRRRKRKGFHGKRPAELRKESGQTTAENVETQLLSTSATSSDSGDLGDTSTSSDKNEEIRENKSAKKLLNSSFIQMAENEPYTTRSVSRALGISKPDLEEAHGFKLQDFSLLDEALTTAAVCSSCRNPKARLLILQENKKREGLSEKLIIKCNNCEAVTPMSTSRKLGGKGGGAAEVNRRAVMAAMSSGGGHATLQKLCTDLNLPEPVTSNAYQQHLVQIDKSATRTTDKIMCEGAERLKKMLLLKDPNLAKEDVDGAIPCSVTVDGTWQKRGHTSKIGVVFVISVDTGEILDYEIKSLFCRECQKHEGQDKESLPYKSWEKKHDAQCQINHEGSSGAMEKAAAIEMFGRSIETRGLKYTTYVGDGDSDSFISVKKAMEEKYGKRYELKKEDCVGHVQKRMGTALRNYKKEKKGQKLSDGKTAGGQNRLTDEKILKIQGYYGKAIRKHKGDLEGMKQAIWAIFHHSIASSQIDLKEQHKYCPQGTDSWCQYVLDQHDNTSKYSEDQRLPEAFRKELNPIFLRLAKDDLLERCVNGLTQNQNEAVNGQLWNFCPKSRFCGKRRVRIAVCQTVGVFNTGAASKGTIMQQSGIKVLGINMMRGLRIQDRSRLQSAAQKVKLRYAIQRRNIKIKKAKNKKASKDSYVSGGFNETDPQMLQSQGGSKRNIPTTRKRQAKAALQPTDTIGITFVAEAEVEAVASKKRK